MDHEWNKIVHLDPISPVVVLKHNEPCTMNCEIALGHLAATLTQKAKENIVLPKATNFEIWRGNTRILDGELREVNLSFERDTMVCTHSDYMQYLDERIYPFHYPFTFGEWPKQWVGVDLTIVVEDILQAMMDEDEDTPPFVFGNSLTGVTTNYQIDAGDSATILSHIRVHADRDDGFDYKVKRDGDNIRFSMIHPSVTLDDDPPVYTVTKEIGQITGFDWTNKGPDSTWLLGLGAGSNNHSMAAEVMSPLFKSIYWRRDGVVNFDKQRNLSALQKLTDAEAKKQHFSQKELALSVLVNTVDLPGFWSAADNMPKDLLGRKIHVGPIEFTPYHTVDLDYRILDMTISPDRHGNEFVEFGLDALEVA